MKKIYLIYLTLIVVIQNSSAQAVEFETRELILKVYVQQLDDTTFQIGRTIINKTDDILYVARFYPSSLEKYPIIEYGIPEYHLPIALGTSKVGIPTETGPRIVELHARDTLAQKAVLYRSNGSHYEKVILDFDYLAPYKYNDIEQKEIFSSLISRDSILYMRRTIYYRYTTSATIIIPIGCINR